MSISSIIKNKLSRVGNETRVKQLKGNITSFYFVTPNTFWSDGLNRIIGNGYDFGLFDILEIESYRFTNRSIPKGNGRLYKLGEPNCDMNTVVGILGYLYFQKSYGDSILDPVHVISAILEWAGVAINKRGYIQFTK